MGAPSKRPSKSEALMWSIALPGYGQILNGKIEKAIVFIFLELLINVKSHLNLATLASFTGRTTEALHIVDFQWLMFYPCVYLFAMWDAYRDAEGTVNTKAFLPFVFAAYFVTVGVMYSTVLSVFGYVVGPIFLPIICLLPGFLVGALIRWILTSKYPTDD